MIKGYTDRVFQISDHFPVKALLAQKFLQKALNRNIPKFAGDEIIFPFHSRLFKISGTRHVSAGKNRGR
jgi:hypothetical protein